MDEYISRETALKKLQMQLLDLEAGQDKGEYSELCENRGARDALDEAIYDIRTLKAADVQPVKHGRWKYYENNGIIDTYICTNCQGKVEMAIDVDSSSFKYCPNCGARMDLKDGDAE